MTADEYLTLLKHRLAASYNVETTRRLDGLLYPLYARSQVIAGKYIFHCSVVYERMELNEHVVCRILEGPATPAEVTSLVQDLKGAVTELVKPSHEHMSSAITGVLIAEGGFTREAAQKVVKSGFTRHFMLGLRGWCFLRLLGVDLTSGQMYSNRRGKEVVSAYNPG